jgi:hypothetical protein
MKHKEYIWVGDGTLTQIENYPPYTPKELKEFWTEEKIYELLLELLNLKYHGRN